MTYGGHAPHRHARLQRLQERGQRILAHHAAHVLHHRHQLEYALTARLSVHVCRRGRSQLRRLVRAGTITVTPAPLSVTASSGTMAYGGTPPAISPTYSGFVNGDTVASLTTAASCTPAATSASSVAGSPYASKCSGAVDPDYAFTYVAGRGHRHRGPAHDHRVERLHDLRRHAAGHHPGLRRFRERRFRLVPHDEADLHDERDERQPGRIALPVVVPRRRRPQLRLHLRERAVSRCLRRR